MINFTTICFRYPWKKGDKEGLTVRPPGSGQGSYFALLEQDKVDLVAIVTVAGLLAALVLSIIISVLVLWWRDAFYILR